jgi:hypothetical protein
MNDKSLYLAACEHKKGIMREYLDVCVFRVSADCRLRDVANRKFPPNEKGIKAMIKWVNQQGSLILVTRFPDRWPTLFNKLIESNKNFNAVWAKEYAEVPNMPGDAKTTAKLIRDARLQTSQPGYGPTMPIGCLPWTHQTTYSHHDRTKKDPDK